jgi:RNA polymerase sigma-70 factor (ECF subfamily)
LIAAAEKGGCLMEKQMVSESGRSPDAAPRQVSDADSLWLTELYERHRDTLYRYILSRGADPATAEDFMSETFLRAARHAYRLRGWQDNVLPWLLRVAHNVVLDDAKSARRRKCVLTTKVVEVPAECDTPDEQAVRDWLAGEVRRCVYLLNDVQRQCLILRFVNDMSVSDTALLMQKSAAAVRQLQHRAISRLNVMLAEAVV